MKKRSKRHDERDGSVDPSDDERVWREVRFWRRKACMLSCSVVAAGPGSGVRCRLASTEPRSRATSVRSTAGQRTWPASTVLARETVDRPSGATGNAIANACDIRWLNEPQKAGELLRPKLRVRHLG